MIYVFVPIHAQYFGTPCLATERVCGFILEPVLHFLVRSFTKKNYRTYFLVSSYRVKVAQSTGHRMILAYAGLRRSISILMLQNILFLLQILGTKPKQLLSLIS